MRLTSRRSVVTFLSTALLASGLTWLAAPPAAATGSVVTQNLDITTSVTWDPANTYYISSSITLTSTGSLTIPAGTVVKLGSDVNFTVEGLLRVEAGSGRAMFTSWNDDDNGLGVSGSSGTPAVGDWGRLDFGDSSDVALDHTDVRYGGAGSGCWQYVDDPMVRVRSGSTVLITHSKLSHSESVALSVDTGGNNLWVDSTEFSNSDCGLGGFGTGTFVANDFKSSLDTSVFFTGRNDLAMYANILNDSFGSWVTGPSSPLPPRAIRFNEFRDAVDLDAPPKLKFNWWGFVVPPNPQMCWSDYYAAHVAPKLGGYVTSGCPGPYTAQQANGTYFTDVIPALTEPLDPSDRENWADRGRQWARRHYGDPVDTATGGFVDQRTDLPFPAAAPGMEWSRNYSSMDVDTAGLLGRGWVAPMEASVTPVAGTGDPDDRDAVFQAANGEELTFDNTGTGVWARPEHTFGDLAWDDGPDTFSIAWDDGSTWQFTASGRLASIADWAGRSATLTWTGAQLTSVVSSMGYELTLAYDDLTYTDQVTEATASLDGFADRVVAYTYDGDGDLETVTRESTVTETVTTDSDGLITEIEVPSADSGLRTKVANTYDADIGGRVTSQTGPNGAVTTFTYYDAARSTVVFDQESGDVTTDVYDPDGRLVVTEDPLGAVVERNYTNGNITGIVDRRSSETVRTFDQGRLTHLETAAGAVTDYDYDGSGRLEATTVTDGEDEFVTTYGYDGAERVPSTITGPTQDGSPVSYQTVVDGVVEDATDADGVVTDYHYNATTENLESVVVDPGGLALTTSYGYDELGRQTVVEVDPDNGSGPAELDISTVTTYDPLTGQVETVTEEGEDPTTYAYNDDGTIDEVTDPTGAVTTYDYDPDSGQQTEMTQVERYSDGETLGTPIEFTTTYGYNGSGEMDSLTRPGDLTSEGDPLSPAQTTTYDLGELARMQNTIVDPGGVARKTVYAYDADGNQCRTTVDPQSGIGEGCTPGTGSGSNLNRSTVTDFDEAGRPGSVTDPAGNVVATVYNDRGLVAASTDATGRVTRFTYDGAGRQLVTTVAMDAVAAPVTVETRTYTCAGRLQTLTEGSGADSVMVWFGYDQAGREISSTVDPGTVAVTGCTATLTPAGAHLETTTGLDPASRPITVTSPGGITATTGYAFGVNERTVTTLIPGRGYTRTIFSPRDEVVATERTGVGGNPASPDSTVSYVYDDRGNLSAAIDANGGVVTYTADGRGNRLTRTSTPDDYPVTETWEYDAADELKVETQPVDIADDVYRETSYTYTAVGEIDVVTDGSGRTTDYDYLADGTIDTITWTDPDTSETRVADYGYTDGVRTCASLNDCDETASDDTVYGFGDESGQVTSIDPPGDDNTITIGHDTAGRRSSLVSPDGNAVAYGYDSAGRLETVDRRPGTTGEVTVYAYDADGQLTGQDLPDPGSENQYRSWSYDPATGLLDHYDEVVDGTRVTTDTAYDQFGRLWIDWTDGTVTTYTYDPADQLTGVHHSDSVFDATITGDDIAYAYDAVGNRTARVQGPPGIVGGTSPSVLDAGDGTIESYDYDDANQLIDHSSATKDDWSYQYDGAGRLTDAYVDNNSDRSPDSGQEQREYAYDPAGQLADATTTEGDTTWDDSRTYDPDGTLNHIGVVQTSPDGPDPGTDPDVVDHNFDYLWDTALAVPQPLQLTTNQNDIFDVTVTFTNGTGLVGGGTDRLYAHLRIDIETPVELDFYLATDIHGSAIPTANTTGFARAASYDEYGNPAGPTLNNLHEPTLGYRGELQTTDTIHLRARNYNPTTGTFTTTDPLDGLDGTTTVTNPYHYTNNNPTNTNDPTGLRAKDGALDPFMTTAKKAGDANSSDCQQQFAVDSYILGVPALGFSNCTGTAPLPWSYPSEPQLCIQQFGPYSCLVGQYLVATSRLLADAYYGVEPYSTTRSDRHEGNAFLHALISSFLTVYFGEAHANQISTLHEILNEENTPQDWRMDLHNNMAGRAIGVRLTSTGYTDVLDSHVQSIAAVASHGYARSASACVQVPSGARSC